MNQSKHKMRLVAKMRAIKVKKATSKTELFRILKKKKDKITYNESPFKSIIANFRSELSKKGYKLIKNGPKYPEEMKESINPQVKSFKENLIKFKNDLIMKNKINNRINNDFDGYYGKNKFKGVKDIQYLFNEEDESAHEDIRYLFNESPFKSIITDIRSNLSKRGHKLIKNGLKYAEEMKDLTYSQVNSFKENLIKFNNDLIKKNKIKKDFDYYYEKHKFKAVKYVKYLSDDFVYEDIRCLFNETNDIESNEIKSYEAKPYEVEHYEVRSNEIKSYENDYIDIKPHKIKSNEIDYIDIKPREIKSFEAISNNIESNETESNEDYCIENNKNEFNKLSNNLVETNTKDIRYIVDHINNGENLKGTLINLEDIRDKFIAYNEILPFGILSKSSYTDLRKMNIISSVIFDDEYNKTLKRKSRMMVKSLNTLQMPLFLGFLKYISEEELSEYIELNKNKVQNVWIDEFKKWLKELRDAIDQKYMIKRELRVKIKKLKFEK